MENQKTINQMIKAVLIKALNPVDPEGILLSEISQKEQDITVFVISLIHGI